MSRSNYYKQRKRIQAERISDDEKAVVKCFQKHHANYGRIRIRKALKLEGITVSEYKIGKILAQNGLIAKSGRRRKRRSNKPTEKQYIEENLILNKSEITQCNYLWCSDITELVYGNGKKLYLCGVIDAASRRIVGWAIDRRQTAELVTAALTMAAGRNPVRPAGAIFHSDRGCQYTSHAMKKLVESLGFRKSMSRPGTPHDNQPIESFWHTLEVEMPELRHLNFESACNTIVSYIELYYNPVRLHSGINYLSPNTFFSLSTVYLS